MLFQTGRILDIVDRSSHLKRQLWEGTLRLDHPPKPRLMEGVYDGRGAPTGEVYNQPIALSYEYEEYCSIVYHQIMRRCMLPA